jgi:hypothetical protein
LSLNRVIISIIFFEEKINLYRGMVDWELFPMMDCLRGGGNRLVVGGILGGDYIPAFVLGTGWERELKELFGECGDSKIAGFGIQGNVDIAIFV